jgi:hypothetical protein
LQNLVYDCAFVVELAPVAVANVTIAMTEEDDQRFIPKAICLKHILQAIHLVVILKLLQIYTLLVAQ